jgi:RNA recognition motif-containing protein
MICNRVANSDTVSIRIFSSNTLYSNISSYVFDHGPSRGKLATGVAEYYGSGSRNCTSTDFYDEDNFYDYQGDDDGSWDSGHSNSSSSSDSDSLKVTLLPRKLLTRHLTSSRVLID